MMHNVLAEVALLSRADVTRTYVFGYSGGAQLAHRYTMAHPRRVARAVIAASGWYTFPDRTQRFPYGIRSVRTLKGVTFHAEDFLRVPIEVMIGTQDTTMHNVRSTARTVAQQGTTRLDRARNWVAAMQRAAATFGLEPRVTLTEVHEVGHDFIEFCERGNLAQRVGRSLFGDSALGDSAPTVARPSGHTLAGSDHQRDLDA
jgi:pimeloyl-ACP methyl ester carboxylesterase